jgi:hypothetical protein
MEQTWSLNESGTHTQGKVAMRKTMFGLVTAAALATSSMLASGPADAVAIGAGGYATAVHDLDILENAQFIFEGRRYCWYDVGWNGPGWYWCGYALRRGFGWGGAEGWRGWRRGELRREEFREERREFREDRRREERREDRREDRRERRF